jgi:hypothetical protein
MLILGAQSGVDLRKKFLVEQELLILPEKMSSPKVLMGFILLDL